jgi:hypothetical protein
MPLTPALTRGEREPENALSPRERVAEGRVRVPSDQRDGLAMTPGHFLDFPGHDFREGFVRSWRFSGV